MGVGRARHQVGGGLRVAVPPRGSHRELSGAEDLCRGGRSAGQLGSRPEALLPRRLESSRGIPRLEALQDWSWGPGAGSLSSC